MPTGQGLGALVGGVGWGGVGGGSGEGAVEPEEGRGERRREEAGGGREGARSQNEEGGGCFGRVNSFSAGRNPDNGKGDESRSRKALKQTWRPGQLPEMTADMMRKNFIS